MGATGDVVTHVEEASVDRVRTGYPTKGGVGEGSSTQENKRNSFHLSTFRTVRVSPIDLFISFSFFPTHPETEVREWGGTPIESFFADTDRRARRGLLIGKSISRFS